MSHFFQDHFSRYVFSFFLLCELVSSGCRGGKATHYSIGQAIDSLDHVKVYYNGDVAHVEGRTIQDGYNIGLKYQCVEFVKRYYFEYYQHRMPDSYGHARDFFDPTLPDSAWNKQRDLIQFRNPSAQKPRKGDLVVMQSTIWNRYGHVAIISQVDPEMVELIQQNPGPSAPSRIVIELQQVDTLWYIRNKRILGWLRKE
ncbi:MAG: CHAP domain-containing protein [Flavobacteriales bacterium]|nr:CHAP domain-containing protein [Flavobacteriales bacterium]